MKIHSIYKSKRLGTYSYRYANTKQDKGSYRKSSEFNKIFQEELEKSEEHLDKNNTK